MVSALPESPSLEYLRKRAKDLLKAHGAGDPSCCQVLRALRRFARADDAAILSAHCGLQEVQFALALDYGFRNWDHLKAFVESLTPPRSGEHPHIEVRAIRQTELDRIVRRCWPGREELLRLFDEQVTIGMAAWEGAKCVGVVHGYRLDDPKAGSERWPSWANWWHPDEWPDTTREAALDLPGPIWCLSCFHVGRTLASDREETLALVHRFAESNSWDAVRTAAALNNLDAVEMDVRQVEAILAELRRTAATRFVDTEPRYYGRGIGTALCQVSADWARDSGYAAVAGRGAPERLFKFATWSGALPYTTYAKLGFRTIGPFGPEDQLPRWAQGDSPPEVMRQVEEAIQEGRPPEAFHCQLMAETF
jgi:GNAT superfamily N-acetyltransferase